MREDDGSGYSEWLDMKIAKIREEIIDFSKEEQKDQNPPSASEEDQTGEN